MLLILIRLIDILILDDSGGEFRLVVRIVKLKYGDNLWLSLLLVWEISLLMELIVMYFVVLLMILNFILVFLFVLVFVVVIVSIFVFFGDFFL